MKTEEQQKIDQLEERVRDLEENYEFVEAYITAVGGAADIIADRRVPGTSPASPDGQHR